MMLKKPNTLPKTKLAPTTGQPKGTMEKVSTTKKTPSSNFLTPTVGQPKNTTKKVSAKPARVKKPKVDNYSVRMAGGSAIGPTTRSR